MWQTEEKKKMAAEYPTIPHSQALPSINYKVQLKVGMVARTCNPALRRGKQKDFERLRPAYDT